jgi:hypothetical protein
MKPLEIIVIGGGAAGFFGAIACAENNSKIKVTLIEAGRSPLAKVKISGGGRCNVTHHCFEPQRLLLNYPRGNKELRGPFSRFQPKDTVAWFESRGVRLKTEADGRMFPITDDSQTIVDCLVDRAQEAGVKLIYNAPVKELRKFEGSFQVELKQGNILEGDRVLIATGSNPLGYRWAEQLGHQIVLPVPSLFTFNIKDPRLKDLAGVSVENVNLHLLESNYQQTGPLLITHWGISGPAVLKLSAWGARLLRDRAYQMSLQINWLPAETGESLRQKLISMKTNNPKKKIIGYCPFNFPKRLWQRLVSIAGIDDEKIWTELSNKELNKLIEELQRGLYKISGKGVFKEEFVTCGGISLKEVDFKTMESKICPRLYFAGEILDLDGITGGFNFQSAWTTSWLAAQAMRS